jgi:transcriptional regulator with XRE-family HTH domain
MTKEQVKKIGGRKKLSAKSKKRGLQLAKLIKQAREENDWNQERLAKAASIGIDTLRSIECARIRTPNIFIVADLAKALGEDLNTWLK